MPEGPSIVILKEAVAKYKGQKIRQAKGNAAIDMERVTGKKIIAFKTWGKHFLICLEGVTIRIHFLLFGTYSIGTQTKPARSLRLALIFDKDGLYFYTCSVKLLEGSPGKLYDWKADVMHKNWDAAAARKKLRQMKNTLACDALLNQEIFAGVGNIIKNEVLYRTRIHPESVIDAIPPRKLASLVNEASHYSFEFLEWKKEGTLKKHWLAHTKTTCRRCELPFIKKYCGKTKRRTFFCTNCQVLYT